MNKSGGELWGGQVLNVWSEWAPGGYEVESTMLWNLMKNLFLGMTVTGYTVQRGTGIFATFSQCGPLYQPYI